MSSDPVRYGVRLIDTPPKDDPPRWDVCEDIEVKDDRCQVIYSGPRYLRCTRVECRGLVTHGMVFTGACWCGNVRLAVAFRLTSVEKRQLKSGYYPLAPWEIEAIQPEASKPPGWGKEEWEKQYA